MASDYDCDSKKNVTADILIGVPSKLKDAIESRDVDLSIVKMEIMDESDFILKEQMEDDVSWILKRIKRVRTVFQAVIFYSSMTDKLRFPVVDKVDKIMAIYFLLEFLGIYNKVVIYVKQERDVRMLVKCLEDHNISVFQALDKNQITDGGSYQVLITSYPVPSFDQSKVIATIFFDIPIGFDDKDDGNELYYRLATGVGAYCEQVVSGCVFHVVSPSDEDRMNQIENYFERKAKELLSVTCYDGFVGLVDVLLEDNVIDATLAATLRRGASNRTLGPLSVYLPERDFMFMFSKFRYDYLDECYIKDRVNLEDW
nr:DEAD-box ATP-dependent RNA helicase 7-like [Tanacetum cinerariifolium]